MNNSPEKINSSLEGEAGAENQAVEQANAESETQKKLVENLSENSSEKEITETIEEMNSVDRDIFTAQKAITETNTKLNSLREEMGVGPTNETSPAAQYQSEKLKQLEKKKSELNDQKSEWTKKYGTENLPEGIAWENEEGNREADGGSAEKIEEKEELELRKKWLKDWEKKAVGNFEKAMQEDWRTTDAANLELTVQLMKLRLPEAMDKEADDFITGKVDVPPFSVVRIQWETASPLERVLNKPNWISKLDISFDGKAQDMVKEYELKKVEEEEASKKRENPQDKR